MWNVGKGTERKEEGSKVGKGEKIRRQEGEKRGKERKKRGRAQKKEGALLGKPLWELNFGYVWDLLPCTDLC